MISKVAPTEEDTALNVDFVRALVEKGILLSPGSARFLINTIDQLQSEITKLRKQLDYATSEAENQGSWVGHYKSKFEEANSEAYEWRDKYAKAFLDAKRLRTALEEIKDEPVLSAWTANQFREIAAEALKEGNHEPLFNNSH